MQKFKVIPRENSFQTRIHIFVFHQKLYLLYGSEYTYDELTSRKTIKVGLCLCKYVGSEVFLWLLPAEFCSCTFVTVLGVCLKSKRSQAQHLKNRWKWRHFLSVSVGVCLLLKLKFVCQEFLREFVYILPSIALARNFLSSYTVYFLFLDHLPHFKNMSKQQMWSQSSNMKTWSLYEHEMCFAVCFLCTIFYFWLIYLVLVAASVDSHMWHQQPSRDVDE